MPEDGRVAGLIRALAGHYRRTEVDPLFEVGRRVWSLGASARALILLLAAAVVFAAAPLSVELHAIATLGLFAIGWSAALAAASSTRRGIVPAVLAAPWLVYYAGLSLVWMGTAMMALPIGWILWVLWRLLPRDAPARAIPIWLAAAAAAGYVSAGAIGLTRQLGVRPASGQLLLGLALALPAILLRRPKPSTPLRFGVVLIGSMSVMAIAVAGSGWRDLAGTAEWTALSFADAGAIVVLLWLWTAGGFAAGSIKLATLGMEYAGRAVTGAWVRAGVPAVVAASTIAMAWRASPSIAVDSVDAVGLGLQIVISIAAAAWIGVQLHQRAPHQRLFRALTVWLLAIAVVAGIVGAAHGVAALGAAAGPLYGAALATVVIGLAIELAKLGREWIAASNARVTVHLGLMTVALCCATALMTSDGHQWQKTQGLMALAGMIHIGVPLALYEGHKRWTGRGTLLPASWRIGMFAAGYAGGLISLAINPRELWPLLIGALLLPFMLFAMRHAVREAGTQSGALAGALFAGGLVGAWVFPYPPTIPFVRIEALVDVLRNLGTYGRPMLSSDHLLVLVSAWLLAASGGALACSRRPKALEASPSPY